MTPTPEQIQLVIDAARQHHRNMTFWAHVSEPAYFESNLRKMENHRALGAAIESMQDYASSAVDGTNHHNALACPYCNPNRVDPR